MRLSSTLDLPGAAVTQRFGWIGTIGSGKTYGATKLAECMLDDHAQIVAIDPVGVWWGLRSAGKKGGPGYSIPVFGGLHGDVPLEVGAGALIADLIVDRKISAVIDLSQIEFDTDRAKFMTDFGRRFFFRKQSKPSAVHLFIEEAQEILPEEPQKNETMMLHTFVRMAKLGRNFGIGISLITQRPQDVSKKALNLSECILAFQLNGTHERAAIKRWITSKGDEDDITDQLPRLGNGECRVVSRGWLKIDITTHIDPKKTADVSSTPQHGARKVKPRELAPVDFELLRVRMKETIDRARADDPKELKKEIAALNRQVADAHKAAGKVSAARPIVQKSKVVTLADGQVKRLEKASAQIAKLSGDAKIISESMTKAIAGANEAMRKIGEILKPSAPPAQQPPASVVMGPTRPGARLAYRPEKDFQPLPGAGASNGDLPPRQQNIINAIGFFNTIGVDAPEKTQIAAFVGRKFDGNFRTDLARMSGAGLVIYPQPATLALTMEGKPKITAVPTIRTLDDLHNMWLGKMPPRMADILRKLLESPEQAFAKQDVAAMIGRNFDGNFRTDLSRMSGYGIIYYPAPGTVQISPQLMPPGLSA